MACRYTYKGKIYEAWEFEDVLLSMPPSEASAFMPSVESVSDAPFIKSTDSVLSLGLKRVIAMAVEGSYDKVAFVNGKQSADRYNLSKQVDAVYYAPNQDGTFNVSVSKDEREVWADNKAAPGKLEDTIGKELAQKIVNGDGVDAGGVMALRGLDLEVGGEGMKTFYDAIVPNAIKSLLKKLKTGAELGVVQMEADPNEELDQWESEDDEGDGSRAAIDMLSQPGFDVTQAMRDQVEKGLPRFSKRTQILDERLDVQPMLADLKVAIKGKSPSQIERVMGRFDGLRKKLAAVNEADFQDELISMGARAVKVAVDGGVRFDDAQAIPVPMGGTPHVLGMLKTSMAPVRIDSRIIGKVLVNKHADEFTEATPEEFVRAIYKPMLVVRDKDNANEFEISTSLISAKTGLPITFVLMKDSTFAGQMAVNGERGKGMHSHAIKTAYSRAKTWPGGMRDAMRQGRILYADIGIFEEVVNKNPALGRVMSSMGAFNKPDASGVRAPGAASKSLPSASSALNPTAERPNPSIGAAQKRSNPAEASLLLKSIKQQVSSGMVHGFGDLVNHIAQKYTKDGGQMPMFSQRVFHGTPFRGIEKFSTDAIGTGEGAQAFGYGLYFTNRKEIGEYYRRKLAQATYDTPDGNKPHGDIFQSAFNAASAINGITGDKARRIANDVLGWVDEGRQAKNYLRSYAVASNMEPGYKAAMAALDGVKKTKGQLYEVEIPEDSEMLAWDLPLSEQPERFMSAVRAAAMASAKSDLRSEIRSEVASGSGPTEFDSNDFLSMFGGNNEETNAEIDKEVDRRLERDPRVAELAGKYERSLTRPNKDGLQTGKSFYQQLSAQQGGDKQASEFLLANGIKGIKYPAESLSGGKGGGHNYVVFDGADTEVAQAFYSKRQFLEWSDGATVLDAAEAAGYKSGPAVFEMYHGTTHDDIEIFKNVGSKEGALGQGPYFTTSQQDASDNYAGIGPDLTGRISREEEQIADYFDEDDYFATEVLQEYLDSRGAEIEVDDGNLEDLKDEHRDAAISFKATANLKGKSDGLVMPVWVKVKKPFSMLAGAQDLYVEYETDEDGEIVGEETGTFVDFMQAAREVAGWYNAEVQVVEAMIDLYDEAVDGVSPRRIFDALSKVYELYDDNGDMVSYGQLVQEIARKAGYDALIQPAGDFFGRRKGLTGIAIKGMSGVDSETVHVVPFTANQVKSKFNRGTYSKTDGRVMFSARAKTWAEDVLAGRRAEPGFVLMDAPPVPMQMFGLGRSNPVTIQQSVVRHLRNRDRSALAPEMVAAVASGLAKPRAVIARMVDGVMRYEAILDWRDADGKPLMVSLRKEELRSGGRAIGVADVRTMFSKDESLAFILRQIGDGRKVWLDEKEVARVKDFTDEGLIPYGTKGAVPPQTSKEAPLRRNGLEVSQATTANVYGPSAVVKYQSGTSSWVNEKEDIKVTPADVHRADGIHFSRRNGTSLWNEPETVGKWDWDSLAYKMQDKLIDLKRVVQDIEKWTGKLADNINVYLQEELYHGRTAKRVKDFARLELNPALDKLASHGMQLSDLEEYLHARHAKEANRVVAQRNPGEPNLQDGGSGMTDAESDAYFASLSAADAQKLADVASMVDAITAKTNRMMVDYGLESQDAIDAWGRMFKNYVPLHREDSGGGVGIGQGFSIKGKETKGRTGSRRRVVDIMSHIAMSRETTVVRGEKNRVAVSLVGLVTAHPNQDFWKVGPPERERVYNPKTGLVEDRINPMYKSLPNVVVAKVMVNGKPEEVAVTFNEDNERAVRLAGALKNLDAPKLEGMLGVSAKITRYFASINTQYNPVFGVINLVRDVQGAILNLGTTPLAGKKGRISKDAVLALGGIYKDIRATRKGGTANSPWSALYEQFQEDGGQTGFRDLFATPGDRTDEMNAMIDPEAWAKTKLGKFFSADGKLVKPMNQVKRGTSFVFDWLSDYNEAMENSVRLAAYKAALDSGMTRDKAASLAKNLTVNFNRKGQSGSQAGAVWAFFNAAMQGSARLGDTLLTMEPGKPSTVRLSPLGKKIVYGGMLLGSLQALALAAAGFGDDEPPDFIRERSLVIPLGGKNYFSIPMPLGFHVIPSMGRIATEFALSGFQHPQQRVASMVGLFADSFNPIGNAGLSMQTLAPTAIDPLVALTENKDWSGRPIAKLSFNKDEPGFSSHRDTATGISKVIAEAINTLSGGNKYVAGVLSPTPDQIDYLAGQVGGGVWRELSKVEQTAVSAVTGEELPTHKIPLYGRFFGSTGGKSGESAAFYANANKLNRLETQIKGLEADGKRQEAVELKRKPEAFLIAQVNAAERELSKLRRQKSDMLGKGAPREAVVALEQQITSVMSRVNRAMEARAN